MNRFAVLTVSIFVLLAVSANAARNPMYYWYGWKEAAENNPAVTEIELGWENNTSWRVDIVLDSDAIAKNRLLLFNTGITREMCKKAAFPLVLEISTTGDNRTWRGLCDAYGSAFEADEAAPNNYINIAPVFSEETGTYLIWLPYGTN